MAADFPTPRYRLGQPVFAASFTTKEESAPCPDCLGTRRWPVTTPGGTALEVECPACRYSGPRRGTRTVYLPRVERLTIGSVRIDTAGDDAVAYMCEETGVGSGTIWRERDLLPDADLAGRVASARAVDAQARYDALPSVRHQHEIYAHNIVDVLRQEEAAKAGRMAWRVRDLIDAVQETMTAHTLPADAADELREAIENAEREP